MAPFVPLPLPFPGSFATEAEVAVLHELNVYIAEKNQVQVRTFQVGHLTWCWGSGKPSRISWASVWFCD